MKRLLFALLPLLALPFAGVSRQKTAKTLPPVEQEPARPASAAPQNPAKPSPAAQQGPARPAAAARQKSAAQAPLAKTLLWRISGNGLKKDSYLFGSMHLQDKRIFNFTDSLYSCLDRAEGFALEIDMNAYIDSMMQRVVNGRPDDDDEEEELSDSRRREMVDSLLKRKNDPAVKRILARIREKRVRSTMKGREMQTIVDGYLYSIAKRKGKWLGSVEDVQNQVATLTELGTERSDEDYRIDRKSLAQQLEDMISLYRDEDLEGIYKFASGTGAASAGNRRFIYRNKQMAQRMDSLSLVRSMFFTVGAAHLPGDSGVITLLTRRGYTLTPILSTTRVSPEKYTPTLQSLPWVRTETSDKTLSLEMPGPGSDLQVDGTAASFKYMMDITDLTFYMFGAFEAGPQASVGDMLEGMAKRSRATLKDREYVEQEGIKYAEATFRASGYWYRVRAIRLKTSIVLMMMGKGTEFNKQQPEYTRFFNSLLANESNRKATANWQEFKLAAKGVALDFPGKPKRNTGMENTGSDEFLQNTYMYTDLLHDLALILQVKELAPGFNLVGDTSYFNSLRESMQATVSRVVTERRDHSGGFPTFRFDFMSADSIRFNSFSLIRGNRIYTLIAGGQDNEATDSICEQFIRSFRLLPNPAQAYSRQSTPGGRMSTTSPSRFKELMDEDEDGNEQPYADDAHYYSASNPSSVNTFMIAKRPFPKYYYATDDSSLVNDFSASYIEESDSLVKWWKTGTGDMQSYELLIHQGEVQSVKRVKLLPSGDTLYTASVEILPEDLEKPENQAFFNDYTISSPAGPSWVFRNKTRELINDLVSADSATAATAAGALPDAQFTSADLPALHQLLERELPDDGNLQLYNLRDRIENKLRVTGDASTVEYIRDHYTKYSARTAPVRIGLLSILTGIHTSESYSVFKKLLFTDTPEETREVRYLYGLQDSLELTRTLFPEMFGLFSHPGFASPAVTSACYLLDSNMISLESVRPLEPQLVKMLATVSDSLRVSADYYSGVAYHIVEILGKLNTTASNEALRNYALNRPDYISFAAVKQLLKNGQSLPQAAVDSFAFSRTYRSDLYDELEKAGQLALFPSRYRNRKSLAEAWIYAYATDDADYEPDSVELVTEKTRMVDGRKQVYLLYRLNYEDEAYLGIVGPYDSKSDSIAVPSAKSGVYFEEQFDKKKLDQLLTDYLAGLD